MIVAIDGPAASGKGTIGRMVAGHYHYHHLDTGLLYRGVAAAMLERSLDATAKGLGPGGRAWVRLLEPFVRAWVRLARDLLAPPLRFPHSPLLMARFGLQALRPATSVARGLPGVRARATACRSDSARARTSTAAGPPSP